MVHLHITEQFSNLWLIYAQPPMLFYSHQSLCLCPSQALPLCNAPDMYGQGPSHWRKALPAIPILWHKLFSLLIMHIHTGPMFVLERLHRASFLFLQELHYIWVIEKRKICMKCVYRERFSSPTEFRIGGDIVKTLFVCPSTLYAITQKVIFRIISFLDTRYIGTYMQALLLKSSHPIRYTPNEPIHWWPTGVYCRPRLLLF